MKAADVDTFVEACFYNGFSVDETMTELYKNNFMANKEALRLTFCVLDDQLTEAIKEGRANGR